MKLLRDIYAANTRLKKPVISFEFSPPRTVEGEHTFFEKTIPALKLLQPDFCSVTYGAGGTTRDKTLDIVARMQNEFQLTTMSHLTCIGATRAEIGHVLDDALARGIHNILALRGDPAGGAGEFQMTPGGFEFSTELIQFIRAHGDFCIAAAGFPEGHIACKLGKHVDWSYLKGKVDAGAEVILTQLFFDNADFFEFYDYAVGKLGVKVPICPGILPIPSTGWIKRFIPLCGARIPQRVADALASLDGNDDAVVDFGIDYATKQCEELLKFGVPGLHFYTVNKVKPTLRIVKNLKLR